LAESATTLHAADDHPPGLAHHFHDLGQQRESAELGMWLFLVTEFMFFGGMFMAYLAYRFWYPTAFAIGSHTMDVTLGTINTAVLLTSSLTMALAVHAAYESRRQALIRLLAVTAVLGTVFLGIKGYEYYHKYEEHHIPFAGLPFEFAQHEQARGLTTFYNLYFVMTGFHALHMVIGIATLVVLVAMARGNRLLGTHSSVVHNVGLYWHFVDLVWVYLFPFLYLVAARGGANASH
jgi:cytochrome c oxidase subunit 3